MAVALTGCASDPLEASRDKLLGTWDCSTKAVDWRMGDRADTREFSPDGSHRMAVELSLKGRIVSGIILSGKWSLENDIIEIRNVNIRSSYAPEGTDIAKLEEALTNSASEYTFRVEALDDKQLNIRQLSSDHLIRCRR